MKSTIDCIHFGPCSGCTLNNPYLPPIWADMKDFFSLRGVEIGEMETGAIVGWRTKARLAVRGKGKIGLFQAGSHAVIPIPHCRIHHPSINKAVSLVEENLSGVSIYDEKTGTGLLRYIQCAVELETGRVQLGLVVQAEDGAVLSLAKRLEKFDLFHSIWLNVQSEATNRILGEKWIRVFGPEFLEQKLAGQRFLFHPGAFSQAHWTLFERLALDVVSMIPEKAKLLEIYAGVGAMGILAASKCTSVDLVENNSFAHRSFLALNWKGIDYHLGDAKEAIRLMEGADCFLLDPPRKGVDPMLLQALGQMSGTIIYVSCDFSSFVRDVELLAKAGWEIKEGKGYLLFPGTNHVEVVARLTKKVSN